MDSSILCCQSTRNKVIYLSSLGIEDSKDEYMISIFLVEQHNPLHIMEGSLQLNGIHVNPALVY